MKTIIKAEQFQELVARIKSRVALLFPSPMKAVAVLATDMNIAGVVPDQFGRYEVTVHGVTTRVGLHKETPAEGLEKADLVKFEATEDFTVEGKTFEKGFESLKLTSAGWLKLAKGAKPAVAGAAS